MKNDRIEDDTLWVILLGPEDSDFRKARVLTQQGRRYDFNKGIAADSSSMAVLAVPYNILTDRKLIAPVGEAIRANGRRVKVWVHLGGMDSREFRKEVLEREWAQHRGKSLADYINVAQFSRRGLPEQWDRELGSVLAMLGQRTQVNVTELKSRLNQTWQAAWDHYSKRTLDSVVDELAFLYLDVVGLSAVNGADDGYVQECFDSFKDYIQAAPDRLGDLRRAISDHPQVLDVAAAVQILAEVVDAAEFVRRVIATDFRAKFERLGILTPPDSGGDSLYRGKAGWLESVPLFGVSRCSGSRYGRLVQSITRYLRSVCGCRQTTELEEADVLVLPYEFDPAPLRLPTFDVLSCKAKKIIVLSPLAGTIFPIGKSQSSRTFVLHPKLHLSTELRDFLDAQPPNPELMDFPAASDIRLLMKDAIGSGFEFSALGSTIDPLTRTWREGAAACLQECLASDLVWQLQYGLATLSECENALGHGSGESLDRPFEQSEAAVLVNEARQRRFLECCSDLHASLCCPSPAAGVRQDHILLVDDSTDEQYRRRIQSVLSLLLPGWTPRWLNPFENASYRRIFDAVCSYDAMSQRSASPWIQELVQLVGDVRFVLVDQLFRDPSKGTEELHGPQFIRGLVRFLVDHSNLFLSPKVGPEVIAVSRADEVETIQSAVRCGAKDYIVKRRLLQLRAVLNRVVRGTADSPVRYRRNFRALYRLPNECIGLLQTICIPGISLSRAHPEVEVSSTEAERCKAHALILRCIPKTDLHVHVGSCMTPQFLAVASLIGLARQEYSEIQVPLRAVVQFFCSLITVSGRGLDDSGCELNLFPQLGRGVTRSVKVSRARRWWADFGGEARKCLSDGLELRQGEQYSRVRSFLHSELGVADFLSFDSAMAQLKDKSPLDLALCAIKWHVYHSCGRQTLEREDLIRVYILVLAGATRSQGDGQIRLQVRNLDVLPTFRGITDDSIEEAWRVLRGRLYCAGEEGTHSTTAYRKNGWRKPGARESDFLSVENWPVQRFADWLAEGISFDDDPLRSTLASGLESRNLEEYLEGCEFTGAEHLRHPFLIHLYARQVVTDFIRKGVFYAELRGSPDGYVNPRLGFEFADACLCLIAAFERAQSEVLGVYSGESEEGGTQWLGDVLGEGYRLHEVGRLFRGKADWWNRHFPCKVSLIFVGKRHKGTIEMILEAAAAAVMRPPMERVVRSASEFVSSELHKCRVVGFDLAGKEVGNPPARFVSEFARLSRLHIPLTVHAGENASAQFINDAVLELGARRIGHGLSLADDRRLMARVREEQVCIELCPVSNHQTSHFPLPAEPTGIRRYPLREFLDNGVIVTINTDNPVISNTNVIREFFQASEAYGGDGLTIWEALRVVRMGYVASFLSLPERRAMLETVDQFLFDFFTDERVVRLLRSLAELTRYRGQTGAN
jgi:adenosine deaminase